RRLVSTGGLRPLARIGHGEQCAGTGSSRPRFPWPSGPTARLPPIRVPVASGAIMLLAICQGLGLAIAVGLIVGVVLPPIMPSLGGGVGAAPLGVLAAGAALNGADEALWPALPVGVIGAGLAAVVSRDVAAGAARRQQGEVTGADAQASGGVTALVVLAA